MIVPQIDHGAIRSHVEMIHGLAKQAGAEGIVTLTRIEARTEMVRGTERFAIGDTENMIAAIEGWSAQPLNLYAPWAVFRKDMEHGSKGGERNVVAGGRHMIDTEQSIALMEVVDRLFSELVEIGLPAGMVASEMMARGYAATFMIDMPTARQRMVEFYEEIARVASLELTRAQRRAANSNRRK